MKLLFYDKFWESMIELPRGIQKKVVEFQKKFRENPTSSAIHLEPVISFKDQSLRSARIDQTYRAIIKMPETGETYYLIWVDHHDRAYEWAKDKLFQWNENTQVMQVFTAPEEIRLYDLVKPDFQTNDLFYACEDRQLIQLGVPDVLIPSVRNLHNLDDLEKIEAYLPADAFEHLFYMADGASFDSIINEIEEGKIREENLDRQIGSINNQRNFIELTDDTLFNDVLSGALEKWKYYLHPSQRKLVSGNFSGSVKVSGGAGTGKTVAALHRLKQISEIRKAGEKILFTTYTRALTENLEGMVKGFITDSSGITIRNIDALAFDLVKQFGLLKSDFKVFGLNAIKSPAEIRESLFETELIPFEEEFLAKEYQDVVLYQNIRSLQEYMKASRIGRSAPLSQRQRLQVWTYMERYNQLKSELGYYHKEELYNLLHNYLESEKKNLYDYVLVDELQDFSNIELRLIRSLVPEKQNDLFMVGDPLQKIYDKKINFSNAGIQVRGKKSQRLRINYRTTDEIRKLAVSIIRSCHFDNFDGEEEEKSGYVSLFHGVNPTYSVFKSKNEEAEALLANIERLHQKGYPYADIAIGCRLKNSLKDFQTALHNSKVPYTRHENGNWQGDMSGVRLLTFHSMKGLEFRHIFLADVNERTCPKWPVDFESYTMPEKESYLKRERSLLYVAVSRAIENVVISGVGSKSEFITL
ncbi:MAG: UvrD-helicase domain-containing protein [Mangrovibacterium sp.]